VPLVGAEPCVVLALPRGGVPVAAPVAEALGAPLDVLLVRKLGVPGQPELAMGALAEVAGAIEVISNPRVLARGAIGETAFARVVAVESAELADRRTRYRFGPPPEVRGRTVVLVDDGLATGASMRAALGALRGRDPAAIVVAVPVGSIDTCRALRDEAEEVVCVRLPERFLAVGQAYEDFSPTTDEEVQAVLKTLARDGAPSGR
jgi:putative phosphoribosyl transferase